MKKRSAICTRVSSLALLALSFNSMAYTSVAVVPGYGTQSFYRTSNYTVQKEADSHALEGCRVKARENGIGQLAKKCVIKGRAKGPGFGAVVFGEDGVGWVTAYGDKQAAVDAAYAACTEVAKNCQENNIHSWLDESGFAQRNAPRNAPSSSCQPPAGKVLRYSDNCINGDCVRTFENGCTKHFRAAYCYDPLKGAYDWKPNGC